MGKSMICWLIETVRLTQQWIWNQPFLTQSIFIPLAYPTYLGGLNTTAIPTWAYLKFKSLFFATHSSCFCRSPDALANYRNRRIVRTGRQTGAGGQVDWPKKDGAGWPKGCGNCGMTDGKVQIKLMQAVNREDKLQQTNRIMMITAVATRRREVRSVLDNLERKNG